MELLLDGLDWQVTPLVPFQGDSGSVLQETWEPDPPSAPTGHWIPATVPGDVLADAFDAGLVPDPNVDMNSRACEWVAQRDWLYRTRFTVPDSFHGKNLRLLFEGVDHECRVVLNGHVLGTHQGMMLPFEFDVSEHLRIPETNTLTILVRHAPPVDEVMGQIGWTSRARTWKARFAYGWDWCTRLLTVGIWKSVRLVATGPAWIDDVWVRPGVNIEGNKTQGHAEVRIRFRSNGDQEHADASTVHARLLDPEGARLADASAPVSFNSDSTAEACLDFHAASPRLWYPNGLGDQPLYRVNVEVHSASGEVSDRRSATFGFRDIVLEPNDDAPKDALPYTLVVNGKRLFIKGWNWVPHEHRYGRVQHERYRRLLDLARHAHCNLLRVWGGGFIERTEFYDLCDRFGLLVWQEFPLSSSGIDNEPPRDDAYLHSIEDQARQLVPLRRNHPSLAIWCGGNELMSEGNVPLDNTHPALARLKSVVRELDPGRSWIPTSASGPAAWPHSAPAGAGRLHDVHGPWQYQGPVEQYILFNRIDPLMHGEFGVEGAANLTTLKRFVSTEHQFPPDASNPLWVHRASWWLHREKLEAMFGLFEDIESFVRASQWMQAEGLRYAIESHRRRMGRCSMVMPWQLNEAFPNTACTNAVDYDGLPKPAYWWIRRAYEPIHVSLKYDRVVWDPGVEWSGEVWVSNDGEGREDLRCEAVMLSMAGESLGTWALPATTPGSRSMAIGTLRMALPATPGVFVLFLTLVDAAGEPLSRNEYLFSSATPPFQPCRTAPPARLLARRDADALLLENAGSVPALLISLEEEIQTLASVPPMDNYFCMRPGERRRVGSVGESVRRAAAWNGPETRVSGHLEEPATTP